MKHKKPPPLCGLLHHLCVGILHLRVALFTTSVWDDSTHFIVGPFLTIWNSLNLTPNFSFHTNSSTCPINYTKIAFYFGLAGFDVDITSE